MKLYTEEQVKHAMIEARLSPWLKTDFLLGDYNPIELPSDEDIWEKIEDSDYSLEYGAGFAQGVKWVIEQIKQQGNGHN
jgi:hypothetical protein